MLLSERSWAAGSLGLVWRHHIQPQEKGVPHVAHEPLPDDPGFMLIDSRRKQHPAAGKMLKFNMSPEGRNKGEK